MSPEQRAERLYDWDGATFSKNDIAIIARAIRAAENAILESVALDREKNGHGPDDVDAARYRSWKSRAPKRKADARPERLYIDRVTPAPKRKAGR